MDDQVRAKQANVNRLENVGRGNSLARFGNDVPAIAAAQRLPAAEVAPYFLDADAAPNPGGWPVGGLTVVQFHNSHLAYAITWYGLALLVAGGAVIVGRHERRLRRAGAMLK